MLANMKSLEEGPELLVDILGILWERERRVEGVDLMGWSEGEAELCAIIPPVTSETLKPTRPMGF